MTAAAAALRAASADWAAAVCGLAGWFTGRGHLDGLRDDAALRVGLHALGELGVALGRAAGPFAQALDLARLREVQHRQHAEADHGGDAQVRAEAFDLVAKTSSAARVDAFTTARS